jgi:molybdate transport system ATP-binding protein
MAGSLALSIERRFAGGPGVAADFTVPLDAGSIVVLFGPSGSGKTTVLRAIAGLDRPDRGVIRFGPETWLDTPSGTFVAPQARRVGCVFQDTALFPHLTVRGNVEYGVGERDRAARTARTSDVLALVELADKAGSFPRELSGGQGQRAALARALAPRPRLLLLDEPFTALDSPVRIRMRRLVRTLVRDLGIAAVLVTHDRNEAIALGDQMIVLAGGRVRQVGAVLEVLRRPADVEAARSVGIDAVIPAWIERRHEGLVDLRVGEAMLRAVDADLDGSPRDVVACIRAEDVTLERVVAVNVSARNHLPGRVVSVDAEGPLDRVTLDCGFPLVALVTRQAREELGLREGGEVVAAVKATAIHLVPRA